MSLVVSFLPLCLHQSEKLITHVDEGASGTLPSQFEVEDPAVEVERLLNVAHLERNVIETYEPGL